nr:MAG: DNA pilot protein [Microvirus sp.]
MVAVAPPSQLPSAPYAPSGGSGFNFGGALSGPLGYGLGAAAGSIAGNAFASNKVNFRGKYARNQHDFTRWANKNFAADARAEMTPNMVSRVKALDAAGLHRLAALGITPSGSAAQSSPQPMIPGQSDYGSAVSEGINTALNVSQNDRMGGLRIEEQTLRNDWLRIQIANSKMAMLKGVSNGSQDVGVSLESLQKPHSGKIVVSEQPPIPHTTETSGYSLTGHDTIMQKPGAIRGQALEDAVGELMAAVFGPFQFAQDVGYTGDQWLQRKYKSRTSDPYKNMGKTGYTKP